MNPLELVKDYNTAIWGQKDISAIDRYFADDALIHSPLETTKGTDKMKTIIRQWHQAFPDMKVDWQDYIMDGNKVVCRWRSSATHTAEFQGIAATNNLINYPGVTIYTVENDKITQYWAFVDMQNVMRQLSKSPVPA